MTPSHRGDRRTLAEWARDMRDGLPAERRNGFYWSAVPHDRLVQLLDVLDAVREYGLAGLHTRAGNGSADWMAKGARDLDAMAERVAAEGGGDG